MIVKYKIIIYDDYGNETIGIIDELEFDGQALFTDIIPKIISKYDSTLLQKDIYIEDLCQRTWMKYFSFQFTYQYMIVDDFHYDWLKFNLSDIQKSFNLFDDYIYIVVNGPGIGKSVGYSEGIHFIIHTDEKDKHEKYPHVHAKYQDEELFIYLKDASIVDDKSFKNPSKTKAAKKFILDHQEELLDSWNKITDSNLCIDVLFDI